MNLIRADITKKADFAHRLDKEHQLSALEADSRSFDWIWSSTFATWLKSNDSLFWIAGKPASGKSTQTSTVLATEVDEHFGLVAHDDMFTLSSSDILEFVLRKNTQPLLIFIDGLDEYQAHKSEVVNLVNDILQFDVRICLSSRNEPPFSVAYRDLLHQFLMDRVNKPGIEAHARGRFEVTLRSTLDHEKRDIALAIDTIVEKSAGVFLWARFAVQEIIDKVCGGSEIPLHSIIDRMPPELEEVYARIFCSFKDDDSKRACGLMLQLIDAAQHELRLAVLFEAMLISGDNFLPLAKIMDVKDVESFKRRIGAVGAELVEIIHVPSPYQGRTHTSLGIRLEETSVRIMHRTVQTYLDKTGWTELLRETPSRGFQQRLWIETCTSFLAGERVKWLQEEQGYNFKVIPIMSCRLEDYVYTCMIQHAHEYERETQLSSRTLLRSTLDALIASDRDWNLIAAQENLVQHLADADYRRLSCSDVHIATMYGLYLYVEEAIAQSPSILTTYVGSFMSIMPLSNLSRRR
jgi:hypothetical protein